MDQRVRPPATVDRRSADFGEAHVAIESERAGILLIHIDAQRAGKRARVFDQRASDAAAMRLGVNEQRFDLVAAHAHERQRPITIVGRDP